MDHTEHGDEHFEEITRVGVTLIKTCGCGMVHLGIGPVTVKLTRDAFRQVADGVRQAESRIAPEGRPELPVLALLKGSVQ